MTAAARAEIQHHAARNHTKSSKLVEFSKTTNLKITVENPCSTDPTDLQRSPAESTGVRISTGVLRSRPEFSGIWQTPPESTGVLRSRPESTGVDRSRTDSREWIFVGRISVQT